MFFTSGRTSSMPLKTKRMWPVSALLPPRLPFERFFQDADARLLVERGVRRRTRGVAGADDQNVIVEFLICHFSLR